MTNHISIQEHDGVKVGDIVRLTGKTSIGTVSSIIDFGTHVVFYIDFGEPIRFPAKREWLELIITSNGH